MPGEAANARIGRYRSQSLRLLDDALGEMRGGRWMRSEELLWGSLTLAVKGVALSRGETVEVTKDDAAVRAYAVRLGDEQRDRRIREAFDRLADFGNMVDRARESRGRIDRVFQNLDDISSAVERLWDLVDSIHPVDSVN